MSSPSPSSDTYLVFGKNGWIGGQIIGMLRAEGKTVVAAESRTENRESVIAEIEVSERNIYTYTYV